MALFTSLSTLSWLAKGYATYAYGLAFLMQSGIVLGLAIATSLVYLSLSRQTDHRPEYRPVRIESTDRQKRRP